MNIQIHEVQRTLKGLKRSSPIYIIISISEVKENFESKRKKQLIIYKGNLIRLSADFSAETLQARKEWDDIFKVLKEKTSTMNTVLRKTVIQK
jgi:hypothetical protein